MRMKRFNVELWNSCVDSGGFVGGYSRIGLSMILRAVHMKSLIESARRRKETLAAYNHDYYLRNKDKLRNYHREYNRRYREERRAGLS